MQLRERDLNGAQDTLSILPVALKPTNFNTTPVTVSNLQDILGIPCSLHPVWYNKEDEKQAQ